MSPRRQTPHPSRIIDARRLLLQGENVQDRAERKAVAQSKRVCLIEPLGRENSEAVARRSLFAVDLELGAFQN